MSRKLWFDSWLDAMKCSNTEIGLVTIGAAVGEVYTTVIEKLFIRGW